MILFIHHFFDLFSGFLYKEIYLMTFNLMSEHLYKLFLIVLIFNYRHCWRVFLLGTFDCDFHAFFSNFKIVFIFRGDSMRNWSLRSFCGHVISFGLYDLHLISIQNKIKFECHPDQNTGQYGYDLRIKVKVDCFYHLSIDVCNVK